VVTCDTSTSALELWVKTDLSASGGNNLYIWYDTSATISQPDVTATSGSDAVWDDNFKLVQHLGSSLLDSTSANNDGENFSSDLSASQIGDGRIISATNTYIEVDDHDSLNITNNLNGLRFRK